VSYSQKTIVYESYNYSNRKMQENGTIKMITLNYELLIGFGKYEHYQA
jgi:hypothetical protein